MQLVLLWLSILCSHIGRDAQTFTMNNGELQPITEYCLTQKEIGFLRTQETIHKTNEEYGKNYKCNLGLLQTFMQCFFTEKLSGSVVLDYRSVLV